MTNTLAVCLLSISLFCCTSFTAARQVPKECSKGPEYWCKSLNQASTCGAVGHCIATVWELRNGTVGTNEISNKFIRLFSELKDVRDMIDEDYLATRVSSTCRDLISPINLTCKDQMDQLKKYLMPVLKSNTSPETMCSIIGLCDNPELDGAVIKKKSTQHLHPKPTLSMLGASRCTWGPSYWCSNFSTGRECGATSHCVQRVWSRTPYPQDDDGICKICKDMVKQARDQLQSNETQEELKEVFEGECKLIPIKIVTKECIKIADDFVPELVETLSSQMDPAAVCSVAGLCNSARIDKLIEEYNATMKLREGCSNCRRSVGIVRKRFDASSYEDFLVGLLKVCQNMGSLSDSCSMLVFQYYENIIEALKKDFTPNDVCHLSGQCTHLYHSHDLYTFPDDNLEDLKATDDVPCEFCEQVVKHLRDTLVANTSEIEFHKVLTGLCKHSGSFKSECLQLVEQYHSTIYYFLVSDLKPDKICAFIGICENKTDVPVAPLLPKELAVKTIAASHQLIGQDEANSYTTQKLARVPVSNKQTNVQILGTESTQAPAVLPIERMFVAVPQPQGDAICSFCQYFLHYLQVELSNDNTEEAIKKVVENACDVLPQSINDECRQFVTQYGPAVIALLVQEIDPASVCPAIGLCPKTEEVRHVSINSEKSNCPLCLFAVEQLETMLKNNRTEESIRKALDSLCNHLSSKLRTQCVDFVESYTEQLVEMLVADMNPQEICVYLKLCTDDKKRTDPLQITNPAIDKYFENSHLMADRNNRKRPMLPKHMLEEGDGDIDMYPHNKKTDIREYMWRLEHPEFDKYFENSHLMADRNNRKRPMLPKHMLQEGDGDIATNEIPDNTVNGRPIKSHSQKANTVCVICEFVLKEIDDQIKDKHNDDEIKKVVHGVCKRMPKSVRADCDQFVEKYSDLVISLLAQELNPDEVCRELKLCNSTGLNAMREEILDCAVCETVVMAVKKVLSNDKVDRNIVHVVEKSCSLLPAKYYNRCHTMMEIYGEGIIHLIEEFGTKSVCQKIGLCATSDAAYVHMHTDKN